MAAIKLGTPASPETMLASELNSLGNDSVSGLSGSGTGVEYNNRTNKYPLADFELVLGSLTPTTGGMVALFLAHALDDTNYPDNKKESAQLYIGSFALDTSASAKRSMLKNIPLPPSKIKLYVHNLAGAAFPASGNTVKMLPYGLDVS